jgi:hypothetical protein
MAGLPDGEWEKELNCLRLLLVAKDKTRNDSLFSVP